MLFKSLHAGFMTSVFVTLSMASYAHAATFKNDMLNMIFSGATETEKQECLSFAEQNAPDPNRFTGHYAQQYIGFAMQCINKRKKNEWSDYNSKITNRYAGKRSVSAYPSSEPRGSELSDLPAFFSERLNDGLICDVTHQETLGISSITYRISQDRGAVTVNSEITQTDFKQEGNGVTYTEGWKFPDLSSNPIRQVNRYNGILDYNVEIKNGDFNKLTSIKGLDQPIANLENPGDINTFSALIEYHRNETTFTQPIISQIRFEGCAQLDVNGKLYSTRIYSISDPYIVPSFMKEGQSFEPLQTRTRIVEYSTELNWPLNFAYVDDRLSIAKLHTFTPSP